MKLIALTLALAVSLCAQNTNLLTLTPKPDLSAQGELRMTEASNSPARNYIGLSGAAAIAAPLHFEWQDGAPAPGDCLSAGALAGSVYPLTFGSCGTNILPLNNTWTGNNTFRNIFTSADNTYNIGADLTRFGVVYAHNGDFAAVGDSTSYLKARHLAIVDALAGGGSIFWDFLAGATTANSDLVIRDQTGTLVLDLVRALGSITINEARLDMNLVPSSSSITSGHSNWSIGAPSKYWNQLYITGLNVDTVFTDLVPTGTKNLGNSSNRWNVFAASLNLGGDITAHNIFAAADNTYNVGADLTRFGVVYAHNGDFAAVGDSTSYLKARHLAIVDALAGGGSIFWDFLAGATTANSDLVIRDQTGTLVLDLVRALGSITINEARLDMNLVPSSSSITSGHSNWSIGAPSKYWNQLYITGLNVDTVFTDLVPTGTKNLGNSSNRWNVFAASLNLGGDITAHNIFAAADNTYNIGADLTRFGVVYAHNGDFATVGDTTSYVKARHLAIVDQLNGGGSVFYDILANVSGTSSSMFVRDNSGVTVLELARTQSGVTVNQAQFDLSVVPSQASITSNHSNLSIGQPTKYWNQLYIGGLNVDTVFTNLIPSGTRTLGNTSNVWDQAFIKDLYLRGTLFSATATPILDSTGNGTFGNVTVTGTCTGCGGSSNLASNNTWTGTNTFNNVVAFNGAAAAHQIIFMTAPSGFASFLELGPSSLWVEQQASTSGDWLVGHFGVVGGVFKSIRSGALANTLILQAGNATFGGNVLAYNSGNSQLVRANKLLVASGTSSFYQLLMSSATAMDVLDNSGTLFARFDSSVAPRNLLLNSNVIVNATDTFSLGSSASQEWLKLWVQDIALSRNMTVGADIIPTINTNSNLGSGPKFFLKGYIRTVSGSFWEGDLVPTTNGINILGSPGAYWSEGYINNLTVGTCTGCGSGGGVTLNTVQTITAQKKFQAATSSNFSVLQLENTQIGPFGAKIEFRATDSSTSNIYNVGGIYGVFDSATFSNGRLTLQYVDAGGALADGLTLKNGKVGIGTLFPTSTLDLVVSGANAELQATSYGAVPAFIGRAAQGSSGSPFRMSAGNTLMTIGGRGYTGSGAFTTSASSAVIFVAGEDWIDSSHTGASINFATVPNGNDPSQRATRLTIAPDGLATFTKQVVVGGVAGGAGLTVSNGWVDSNGGLTTSNVSYQAIQAASGGIYARSLRAQTYTQVGQNFGAPSATSGDAINNGALYYDTGTGTLRLYQFGWVDVATGTGAGLTAGSNATITGTWSFTNTNAYTFSHAVTVNSSGASGGDFTIGANANLFVVSGRIETFGGYIVSDTGFKGPSGTAGASGTTTCAGGQAIKSITLSGGIVTAVTCAIP